MNNCWRAFTLIELLVVVSVLGILTTIVGINYRNALHKADAAACQQNLRTIFNALQSYRLDYNHFPPADGVAGTQPHPDKTEFGCGPAANGFWSGVSLLLVKHEYCTEDCFYCPALKRRYQNRIEAWPGCQESEWVGKHPPQWQFLRFAYNTAATDAGAYDGGESNIDRNDRPDVWLVRCLHLDIGQYNEDRDIPFPFYIERDEENPGLAWWGEYELTLHGKIHLRPVEQRKH